MHGIYCLVPVRVTLTFVLYDMCKKKKLLPLFSCKFAIFFDEMYAVVACLLVRALAAFYLHD